MTMLAAVVLARLRVAWFIPAGIRRSHDRPVLCSGRDAGSQRADRFSRGDVFRDVLCIPSDAGEHIRHRGVEEEETDEVQPGLARHDATNMLRTSRLVKGREMDPR